MQQSTSDIMRKLMRLVVTDGYGKKAEVPGYYRRRQDRHGGEGRQTARAAIKEHANVAAFISVFPMNAPRYAVYMMLDEPHGNKSTYGFSTAGWVAAPAAGRVIARIGADAGAAAGHRRTRRRSTRRWRSRWSPAVRPERRRGPGSPRPKPAPQAAMRRGQARPARVPATDAGRAVRSRCATRAQA